MATNLNNDIKSSWWEAMWQKAPVQEATRTQEPLIEQAGPQEAVAVASSMEEVHESALQRKSKRDGSVLDPLSPEYPTPLKQPKLPDALPGGKLMQENRRLWDKNAILKEANAALQRSLEEQGRRQENVEYELTLLRKKQQKYSNFATCNQDPIGCNRNNSSYNNNHRRNRSSRIRCRNSGISSSNRSRNSNNNFNSSMIPPRQKRETRDLAGQKWCARGHSRKCLLRSQK